MAAVVVAAYFWTDLINPAVLAIASLTILVSLTLYIWTPKDRLSLASLGVFGLLMVMSSWLVATTGFTSSPFIGLWMLAAVFAGAFGWLVVGAIGVCVIGLLGYGLANNSLGISQLLTSLVGGILPLVVGVLIWYRQPTNRSRITTGKADISHINRISDESEGIINAIGDGILAIDGQGIIRLINPAGERLLGWASHDTLKLSYKSVLQIATIDGDELEPSQDIINQALNLNQQFRSSDLSLTTKSGKRLLVSITVSPIGAAGSGVIVVLRDITKEKTEEREQAEFISTASHEMRTPVASIEGYLGLALNPSTASIDQRARAYIEKAHESTKHLGRLFQDLLDITKAEDGRLASHPELINAIDFTRDIATGLTASAEAKGLSLVYQPGEKEEAERNLSPVYFIHQDKGHYREVISNLIENAIKYTPSGQVKVDIAGTDDTVTISIEDSGIGIPSEDIPHLFQKFYRVDNTDTREIGGTGLGLYLSRRLVESMNGRIWVESEAGKGSCFYVELPRLSHTEATQIKQDEAAANAARPAPEPTPVAETPVGQVGQVASVQPVTQSTPQPIAPQAPAPQPQPQPNSSTAQPANYQQSTAQTAPTLSEIERNPENYRHLARPAPRTRPPQGGN